MLCLCAALLTFQFQTDLGWAAIFNQLLQIGKTVAFHFCRNVHALVTLYVHLLSSDLSKFDR